MGLHLINLEVVAVTSWYRGRALELEQLISRGDTYTKPIRGSYEGNGKGCVGSMSVSIVKALDTIMRYLDDNVKSLATEVDKRYARRSGWWCHNSGEEYRQDRDSISILTI